MKKRSFIALLLALVLSLSTLVLAACGDTTPTTTDDSGSATNNPATSTSPNSGTVTPSGSEKINVKLFKVGKANATLIRADGKAILIDTGEDEDEDANGKQDDGEEILQYLAEKNVTKIDYLIVSQFNKNHYGSVPTILEGVAVDKILEPDYDKTGATAYDAYRAALTKANITPEVITQNTTLQVGGVTLTIYPATGSTSSAATDEFYSLAVSVDYSDFSMLLCSDIYGARVNTLISDLNGKTFDLLQIPYHGAYSDTVEPLLDATQPPYAVIFASNNNPEDVRVTNLLTEKNITYYVTKGGSVEVKLENGILTVKQ